jgi:hypothetical protein
MVFAGDNVIGEISNKKKRTGNERVLKGKK